MKVHELRTILDHVPDDLVVFISGSRGMTHVGGVERARLYRNLFPSFDTPNRPPHLALHGGYPPRLWFEEEPRFTLRGQFRRSDELLTALGDHP